MNSPFYTALDKALDIYGGTEESDGIGQIGMALYLTVGELCKFGSQGYEEGISYACGTIAGIVTVISETFGQPDEEESIDD